VLATGLTFVIGAGEIDLSFPGGSGLLRLRLAILFKDYDLGWIAVAAGLASGILVGFVNGFLIARVGIPSFIATLGTQFFWSGMATVLSGGKSMRCAAPRTRMCGGGSSAVSAIPIPMPGRTRSRSQALWTLLIVGLSLVHPQPPSFLASMYCSSAIRNDVSRVVGS